MKNKAKRYSLWVFLALASFAAMGCSKVIIRENIISTVNTGIGVTLAENPQTQLYEVKIGYIRSQFYSIPTGKLILEEEPAQAEGGKAVSMYCQKTVNQADITPQLVSGIKVHTGVEQLFLGVDVSENFAVGEEAVNSKAAVAMYIASAEKPQNAQSAAEAVNSLTYDNDPSVKCINKWLKDKNNVKALNDWWKRNSLKGIGVIGIKSRENKDLREKFMEELSIGCD
jgi:hypothetical protein